MELYTIRLLMFQICCPPEYLYGDFGPTTTTRRVTVNTRSLLPSTTECGVQNGDKIVGGTETDIGEHPWMVLLRYDKRKLLSTGKNIKNEEKYMITF